MVQMANGTQIHTFMGAENGTEMSQGEKACYEYMVKPSPELPYELRPMKVAVGGQEQEYVIPEEDKQKVLNDLWPFEEDAPNVEDTLIDLHSRKKFKVKDFRVIRCRERNMICAPDYPNTGGMLVDWMHEDTGEPVVLTQPLKRQSN